MGYYTIIIILVLFALGVLSVLVMENDRITKKKKNLFLITNIIIAFAALAECAGIHMAGNVNIPTYCLATVKAFDYILTPMAGGAIIVLIQKPNSKAHLIQWLFIANTVFQIVSIFTGWMIVIDENHQYTHGPLYPVYMALYIIVIVFLAIEMILYGKSFRKQNRISLYATMLLVLAGVGIQELLGSDYRVAYIALTFGASYLYIHYSEFAQMEMDEQIYEQQVKISIDALTGVNSRFAYVDAMNVYTNITPKDFAVFMIDINGLKATNDSLGHEAGDELICGAADCIKTTIGKSGKVFRIGGDEFVVFSNMSKERADYALLELAAATKVWSGKLVKKLSVSAGYALAKDYKGYSVENLAKEADKTMYEQKKAYYIENGIDRRKTNA